MTLNDVDVIDKTPAYQGYFRIDRYRLRHRLFEGGWSEELEREVFERGHAVGVLPYDPVRDVVVLVEQFRPGAFAALSSPWRDRDASPWLIECIAGIIEEGEAPEEVVRRESIEEAGCRIQQLEPICRYLVSPGASSETVSLYGARIDATDIGGIHGVRGEDENIRVLLLPVSDAFAALESGRVDNAMTIIALQWFKHNRDRLHRIWRGDDRPGEAAAGP